MLLVIALIAALAFPSAMASATTTFALRTVAALGALGYGKGFSRRRCRTYRSSACDIHMAVVVESIDGNGVTSTFSFFYKKKACKRLCSNFFFVVGML